MKIRNQIDTKWSTHTKNGRTYYSTTFLSNQLPMLECIEKVILISRAVWEQIRSYDARLLYSGLSFGGFFFQLQTVAMQRNIFLSDSPKGDQFKLKIRKKCRSYYDMKEIIQINKSCITKKMRVLSTCCAIVFVNIFFLKNF